MYNNMNFIEWNYHIDVGSVNKTVFCFFLLEQCHYNNSYIEQNKVSNYDKTDDFLLFYSLFYTCGQQGSVAMNVSIYLPRMFYSASYCALETFLFDPWFHSV